MGGMVFASEVGPLFKACGHHDKVRGIVASLPGFDWEQGLQGTGRDIIRRKTPATAFVPTVAPVTVAPVTKVAAAKAPADFMLSNALGAAVDAAGGALAEADADAALALETGLTLDVRSLVDRLEGFEFLPDKMVGGIVRRTLKHTARKPAPTPAPAPSLTTAPPPPTLSMIGEVLGRAVDAAGGTLKGPEAGTALLRIPGYKDLKVGEVRA
jgi:hypothetical protein